jgi:hypothetical protein
MDAFVTLYDALMWPLVRILIVAMVVILAAVIGGIVHLALTRPRAHEDEYGAWGDPGSWRGNKPTPDEEDER